MVCCFLRWVLDIMIAVSKLKEKIVARIRIEFGFLR